MVMKRQIDIMNNSKLDIKKGNIKLSIVVPVYNVEPYIKRCLDSIISQTYENLEIILVDDGSTDKSGEICDEYALIDSRIKVIHKKNGGIVSARKCGVLNATGEYITDVDSDDWIEINAYSYIVEKLRQYNPDILVLGYQKEYRNGFIQKYKQKIQNGMYQGVKIRDEFVQKVREAKFFCNPIDMILWNKVIRTEIRKIHQTAAPDRLNKGEDDAVVFPCLLDAGSIYVDSKCFYHYCVRESSALWNDKNEDYQHFLVLSNHLIRIYSNIKNRNIIKQDYLLYQLFYQLMLCNPERLINKNRCLIYPKIKPYDNIIIYGKGVFANRLIKRINELHYCNIIDNFDKLDIDRIRSINENSYNFIVIAILNSEIVSSSIALLTEIIKDEDKILFIEKENLSIDLLPIEVQKMWMEANFDR